MDVVLTSKLIESSETHQPSAVSRLVPFMAEQRQDDDQPVEELDVKTAQACRDNAGLDE